LVVLADDPVIRPDDLIIVPPPNTNIEQAVRPVTAEVAGERPLYRDDLLHVVVQTPGAPDIAQDVRIEGQGIASLPIVGDLTLGGLTLPHAKQNISDAYTDAGVKFSTIAVTLAQSSDRTFTVRAIRDEGPANS
jgi:protein involved in polysaccharide export with SLBB domain